MRYSDASILTLASALAAYPRHCALGTSCKSKRVPHDGSGQRRWTEVLTIQILGPYRFAQRRTACAGWFWVGQLAPVSPMVVGASFVVPNLLIQVALTTSSSAPHMAVPDVASGADRTTLNWGGGVEPSLPSLPGGPGSPWAPRGPGSPLPVSPLSPLSPFGPEQPARASAMMIIQPANIFFVISDNPRRSRGVNILGDQLVPNTWMVTVQHLLFVTHRD